MSIATFWSEERWTRAFGYRPGPGKDNPYSLGYHIGQDVAGGDFDGMVPAVRAGRVVVSGRSAKIGGYVIVRVGDEYDTYCHLNTASLPRAGSWLTEGDEIAPLARSTDPRAGHDYMGSASDGPHCHMVRSTRPDTAYNPVASAVLDPRPIIRAALTAEAPAAGGATPYTPKGWDEMASKEEIQAAVRDEIRLAVGIPTVRIVTELNGSTQQLVGPLRKITLQQSHFDLLVRYRDGAPLLEPEMGMVSALLSMVTYDYTDDKLAEIRAQIDAIAGRLT